MLILHDFICTYRYDLYDVEIRPETSYEEQLRSGMSYAPRGHFYVTLSLEEELFEGTNSIRYYND